MKSTLSSRLERLLSIHRHDPYVTDLFTSIGLPQFYVGRHVLRPDASYVSKYLTRWLAYNQQLFRGRHVLEIGCGSGVQTVTMALYGAAHVVATDISVWAIRSCIENIRRLRLHMKVSTRLGDMFSPIDSQERFDFALFNHPFFRGSPNGHDPFELALLDNRDLAGIFLTNVWKYIRPGGIVIMPYSTICGSANDPRRYAKQLSLNARPLFWFQDEDGSHLIVAFCRNHNNSTLVESVTYPRTFGKEIGKAS